MHICPLEIMGIIAAVTGAPIVLAYANDIRAKIRCWFHR